MLCRLVTHFTCISNVTNLLNIYLVTTYTVFSGIVTHPNLSAKNDLSDATEVIQVMNSSADFPTCYDLTWNQSEHPCDMIVNLDTPLPYPNTTSSIVHPGSVTSDVSTATTQKH